MSQGSITTAASDLPATAPAGPVGRTIPETQAHYGWTRTFIYEQLAEGALEAVKAGRRTIIITASANRVHASLPRAVFGSKRAAADVPRGFSK